MIFKRAALGVLIGLITATCGLAPALAQEMPPRSPGEEAYRRLQDTDGRIKLARRLIRAKQYDNAARLLEEIFEERPSDNVVYNLLKSCYDVLGQNAKAELLTRKVIEQQPNVLNHRTYLAEVLAKMGRTEESKAAYDDAIALASPENLIQQTVLVHSMMSCGQDDLALARIDQARTTSGKPTFLALERGTILEGKREYKAATEEYLAVLDTDTTHEAGRAERRLAALLEFSGSSGEVEEVLMNLTDTTAGERTLNLLADYYIKAGKFEDAFSYALIQDSLAGFDGRPLLNFIYQCRDRKSWEQVNRMADYIQQRYPQASLLIDVSSLQADALARLGQAEAAIAAYEKVFRGAPEPRAQGDAVYGIGEIYFQILHDYPKARLYFDSVVNNYPRGFSFLNARKNIPHCYLREGNLATARKEFAALAGVRQLEEYQEETAYYLALTAFFEARFDSSEIGMRKLMVDYPRGYYVNDAMELVLLMDEAQGDEDLLKTYSEALFFREQGLVDSTRARFAEIAEADNQALADVALFRLALLDLEAADSTAAVATIDRLIADFPDSYYLPYGMKLKADMLLSKDPGAEEARRLYRSLLESYPDYPFASEVREKLRKLEAENSIG